jgi:hypothetical protein
MANRFCLALLLCTAAASAEERFGTRGQIVPLGSIGYVHSSGSNSFSIAPGLFWFPIDHLALGMSTRLGYTTGGTVLVSTTGGASAVSSTSFTSLGLAPAVAGVISLGGGAALFPQGTVQFNWFWFSGGSLNEVDLNAFVPVIFMPVPHLFLGFGPFIDGQVSGSGSREAAFGLQSQIGGWF